MAYIKINPKPGDAILSKDIADMSAQVKENEELVTDLHDKRCKVIQKNYGVRIYFTPEEESGT